MGVFLQAAVLSIPHPDLSAFEVNTLSIFASYADDSNDVNSQGKKRKLGGNISPSHETITDRQGKYRQAISPVVKKLVGMKWLIADGKTKNGVIVYRLNIDMLTRCIDGFGTMTARKYNLEENYTKRQWVETINQMMKVAVSIKEEDGYGKEWNIHYQCREVDWNNTFDGITKELWNLPNDEISTEELPTKVTVPPPNRDYIFGKGIPDYEESEENKRRKNKEKYKDSDEVDDIDIDQVDDDQSDSVSDEKVDDQQLVDSDSDSDSGYGTDSDSNFSADNVHYAEYDVDENEYDYQYPYLDEVPIDSFTSDKGLDDYEHYVQSLTASDAEYYIEMNAMSKNSVGEYSKEKDDEVWAPSSSKGIDKFIS